MKRFTEYNKFGDAEIIGIDGDDLCEGLYTTEDLNRLTAALNRLAAYEDIGLTPEQVKSTHNSHEVHI